MHAPAFCLINLGCAKNVADAECLLARMVKAGFILTNDLAEAELCLVNTCGFLDESRREAALVLEQVAQAKRSGALRCLVALGCLVERAGGTPSLRDFLRHADVGVGFKDYDRLPDICLRLLSGHAVELHAAQGMKRRKLPATYFRFLAHPRLRMGTNAFAYLKVGEGCSNCCNYCSIPLIRGRRISRPLPVLVREAEQLLASGVQELDLIAQDTTAYGLDQPGHPRLPDLLEALLKLKSEAWIRVLYAHPRHLTRRILDVMASDARICPYVDLPLQHIHDRVLARMGRGYDHRQVMKLLDEVRARLPTVALRTTFIVGHPGEGSREFETLRKFVAGGWFAHLGVFVYSPEPGTASASFADRTPLREKLARQAELMRIQAGVSHQWLQRQVGGNADVILEEWDARRKQWRGRTRWQAPEVDGATFVSTPGTKADFSGVRVAAHFHRAGKYDLFGTFAQDKAALLR